MTSKQPNHPHFSGKWEMGIDGTFFQKEVHI